MTNTAVAENKDNKPRTRATMVDLNQFQTTLDERAPDIIPLLPQSVTWERFRASAIAAVKQNQDLLLCTGRSIMHAIEQSAADGLLPDGKEGVITSYNEKQKDDTYEKTAKWNPMAWGLRKRAREIDHIIVSTEVVYAADFFHDERGDNPSITHQPAEGARGAMTKAYAIFRRGAEILHREVMDKDQIERVKKQSKIQGGLLWTTFVEEAWRKTVLRRGFKSVPCGEKLEQIVRRDDDLYEFDNGHHAEPPVRLTPPSAPKPTVVASSVQRARPPSPKRPGKRTSAPYGGGPTDAEIDASQAKHASVLGIEDAEVVQVEPKQQSKRKPPGLLYDDDESAAQLSALLEDMAQPMDRDELREFVGLWGTSVQIMLPLHQKRAQASLSLRDRDVFGEQGGKLSFLDEPEAD